MTQLQNPNIETEIYYPESDGKPLGENTLQFDYIVLIKENLEILYRNSLNVFVAGDLFWYPVQRDARIYTAPDVMVVFGRPKGKRGSYKQWEEDGIAPQIAFEIISPSNSDSELDTKRKFYQLYGVQEYYEYGPEKGILRGWQRQNDQLVSISSMQNWVSPLLGIRFELQDSVLKLYDPNGQPFLSPVELSQQLEIAKYEARQKLEALEELRRKLIERGIDPDAL